MKLTKKKAKELSIKKWEWIVKNCEKSNYSYSSLISAVPELNNCIAECGYCEYYYTGVSCGNCPLIIEGIGHCGAILHPWYIWNKNNTKENAQAVLDLIKKS